MKLSAICSQVALLLFSKWDDPKSPYYRKEDDKTKLVIPFGLHYNADGFIRYINNLEYEAVEGGHTRTDKALGIANNQVRFFFHCNAVQAQYFFYSHASLLIIINPSVPRSRA